jgi:hypothetical protein
MQERKEKEELRHISLFSIAIEDPETGHWRYAWNKYIKGQFSVTGGTTDRDMEIEMARLIKLGFKIVKSRTGVACCISENSYDKSITDQLKNKEYFIENYTR